MGHSQLHRPYRSSIEVVAIFWLSAAAHSFYVAPTGSDSGDGSLAAPFATLQHCIDQLPANGPGSSCVLRGGRYFFPKAVRVYGLHGEAEAPYTIAAYKGEDVVIDGSVLVNTSWIWSTSACPNGCWYTDLPAHIKPWQLFLDDDLLTPARWPNAFWSDKTVFDASHWAVSSRKSTYEGGKFVASRNDAAERRTGPYGDSLMVDATIKCNRRLEACTHSGCAHVACHPDEGNLGSAKLPNGEALNVTGATAVMNLGSWTTHAAIVKSHVPGSDNFTYRAAEDWPVNKFVAEHNIYFLENKLELLDAPTEWFFDRTSGRLYLKTPGDTSPVGRVRARVQDYAMMIRDAKYLTVRGLRFFATTIYSAAQYYSHVLQDCRFESLEFKFAGGMRRMLGELEHASPMVVWAGWNPASGNNTIFNSTFYGFDGWPIFSNPTQGRIAIKNCLFEYIDWTCLHAKHPKKFRDGDEEIEYHTYWGDSYTLITGDGDAANPNVFERNTILHHGSSEGLQLKDNTIARLNRIGYKYSLQNDGALIQTSGHELSEAGSVVVKQNWVHDSVNARNAKWGIRADRVQTRCMGANDSNTWPFNVRVEENVVWRTLGINLKGNSHTAHRNLVLWPGGKGNDEASDSDTGGLSIYNSVNEGTCQCGASACTASPHGCCVPGQSSTFENFDTVVTQNAFAMRGSIRGGTEHFPNTSAVDAAIGVPSAAHNSAGGAMENLRDPNNFDFRPKADSYFAATCIGAYDAVGHGGHYWIPGRQEWAASFPIPPNGVVTDSGADLMFLQALEADGHRVYASTTSSDSLVLVGTLTGDANILTPPASLELKPGAIVYWRVDAYDSIGTRTGPVWNFSVASPADNDSASRERCRTYSSSDTPVALPDGTKADASFITLPAASTLYAERVKVTNWTVCINLTVGTTLSDWHVRAVARYGQGASWAMHFSELDRWKNPSGVANRYVQACFDDAAEEHLPTGSSWDAAAPFTGTWKPQRALLTQFADNNHAIEETEVDYRLKIWDHKSGDAGGTLEGWSVRVCVQTLPTPSRSEWPQTCPSTSTTTTTTSSTTTSTTTITASATVTTTSMTTTTTPPAPSTTTTSAARTTSTTRTSATSTATPTSIRATTTITTTATTRTTMASTTPRSSTTKSQTTTEGTISATTIGATTAAPTSMTTSTFGWTTAKTGTMATTMTTTTASASTISARTVIPTATSSVIASFTTVTTTRSFVYGSGSTSTSSIGSGSTSTRSSTSASPGPSTSTSIRTSTSVSPSLDASTSITASTRARDRTGSRTSTSTSAKAIASTSAFAGASSSAGTSTSTSASPSTSATASASASARIGTSTSAMLFPRAPITTDVIASSISTMAATTTAIVNTFVSTTRDSYSSKVAAFTTTSADLIGTTSENNIFNSTTTTTAASVVVGNANATIGAISNSTSAHEALRPEARSRSKTGESSLTAKLSNFLASKGGAEGTSTTTNLRSVKAADPVEKSAAGRLKSIWQRIPFLGVLVLFRLQACVHAK